MIIYLFIFKFFGRRLKKNLNKWLFNYFFGQLIFQLFLVVTSFTIFVFRSFFFFGQRDQIIRLRNRSGWALVGLKAWAGPARNAHEHRWQGETSEKKGWSARRRGAEERGAPAPPQGPALAAEPSLIVLSLTRFLSFFRFLITAFFKSSNSCSCLGLLG